PTPTMEKAVFKATNKDCVTPKKKHVDRLVQMTWMEPPASMAELFVVIEGRFSEPSWVISFKALILIHLLMQEGEPATVFDYLSRNSNVLDLHQFRDKNGTRCNKNIRLYAHYLIEKVNCYKDTQVDFVRDKYPSKTQIYGEGKLNIQRLLTEISYIQRQIYFFIDTVDNEVTFTAFRLLIRDLLKLFQAMNVGVIKMLKSYFIISYDDMRRSLELYKRFVKITDRVTDYLENGRQLQASFGINIPLLNHAPVSLAISLEEYLQTPEARLPVAEKIKNQKGTSGPPTLPASMAKNATAPTTFGGKPASKEPASPTK
ncbi:AP180 N-terminal homology domain-containing protein, partial [Dimargaris cristalligena]